MTDRTKNLIKIYAKNKLNYKKTLQKASGTIPVGYIADPDYFVNFIIFMFTFIWVYKWSNHPSRW